MKSPPLTEKDLMEQIGPFPTVKRVAEFFDESVPTTWRRLRDGELERVDASGIARVSLRSIVEFLNRGIPYQLNCGRGRKKQSTKKEREAAQ